MERLRNSFLILITIISYFKFVDVITIGTRIAKPNSIKPSQMSNSSVPKIMLKNYPNKSEVNLTKNTMEIEFTCESNIPNRWIWNPLPDEEDIEIEKTWTTSSFLSNLIIKIPQDGIPDVNFTCTTTMGLKLSGKALVTCATIKPNVDDRNETGLQSYSVKIIRNIPFENCTSTSSVAEIKHPPNLTVDLSNEVKASCSLENWEPASQYCLNLDVCESKILSSGENSLYLGTVGKITNSTGKKILKNFDYPHVLYCQQYRNPSIAPFMLIYPGYESKTWTNFTYYSTLKDAISSNSIQIIAKGEMSGNFHFAEKEKIQVACRAIKFLYINGFRIGIGNQTVELLSTIESEKNSKLYEAVTNITLNSKLYGSTNNTMTISCSCPIWNWESSLGAWGNSSVEVSIFPAKMPNATVTKKLHKDNDLVTVNCSYNGWPQPVINWTTSQPVDFINETGSVPENNLYRENGSWYQLKRFSMGELNTLTVNCIVTNFEGNCSVSVKIDKGLLPPHVLYSIIGGCAIILIAAAAGIIFFYWQYRKKLLLYAHRRKLTVEDIEEFYSGTTVTAIGFEALQMPYNNDYEIKQDDLILDGTILGSGQFGLVLKGQIGPLTVAVKTVKPTADIIYLKSLLSELKILQFVGAHRFIVNLIGANTTNMKKGEVFLILDYCSNGSLVNFLRQCRERYVDFFGVSTQKNKEFPLYENSRDIILTTVNLIRFSFEIASAMDHLASKNVIHGDLASRNVLVTEDLHVKICDFGLAKQLLHYSIYVQKIDCPLPLRWMAIESLQDMEFSQASDRWSFGVCLWEIFSLAELPYPGVQWSFDSYKMLLDGYRMAKPTYANDSVYKLMLECWEAQPQNRPIFQQIVRRLKEEEEGLLN